MAALSLFSVSLRFRPLIESSPLLPPSLLRLRLSDRFLESEFPRGLILLYLRLPLLLLRLSGRFFEPESPRGLMLLYLRLPLLLLRLIDRCLKSESPKGLVLLYLRNFSGLGLRVLYLFLPRLLLLLRLPPNLFFESKYLPIGGLPLLLLYLFLPRPLFFFCLRLRLLSFLRFLEVEYPRGLPLVLLLRLRLRLLEVLISIRLLQVPVKSGDLLSRVYL